MLAHAILDREPAVPTNLVQALREAAAGRRGVTLVSSNDDESWRPWAGIYRNALRRAVALRAAGVREGDVVILVLNTSFELIEAYFGILIAGAIPAPAYRPPAMAKIEAYHELLTHIATRTGARHLVTDANVASVVAPLDGRVFDVLDITAVDADATHFSYTDPEPEMAGLIQCTSGSTSHPKPVVLRHANLIANVMGVRARCQMTEDDVFASWLPLFHDMGLIGVLFNSVVGGCDLVLMAPVAFLMDPGAWWRAIDRHRASFTAAPNFAFAHTVRRMDAEEIATLDLSCVRGIICGAEPIQPKTIAQLYEALAPAKLDPGSFCASYGLAESCVAVTVTEPGLGLTHEKLDRRALSAVGGAAMASDDPDAYACARLGRPIPGTVVRVRDTAGNALSEGHIGEVFVSGASVMAGYLNDPVATNDALVNGELKTGDLGFLVDGELFIVGRIKHMLIVRGQNYYAEDIESVIEAIPGAGLTAAFGVFDERRGGDALHIAVETRITDPAERDMFGLRIAEAVAEAIGIAPAEVHLVSTGTLPKTSSGKKQRLKAKQLIVGRVDVAPEYDDVDESGVYQLRGDKITPVPLRKAS
jgi:fatty-acyl-CoA synthase